MPVSTSLQRLENLTKKVQANNVERPTAQASALRNATTPTERLNALNKVASSGRTAYQSNLQTPVQQNSATGTLREAYGKLKNLYNTDREKAYGVYDMLNTLQQDPSSRFFNPYSQPTNKAVASLQQKWGVDTSQLTNKWFEDNTDWQAGLMYNGTTLTPSKPGKRANDQQLFGYDLYQYKQAEDLTVKVEQEWEAMQQELAYKAKSGRYASEQAIIDSLDMDKKYKNLKSMKDSISTGKLLELNRAIGYSEDAMYGTIWAALNDQPLDGNMINYMANSALGTGNKLNANPETVAKLTKGSDDYAPYSVGSTMEEEGLYFNMQSFPKGWVEQNKYRLNSNDETERKNYIKVAEAEETTVKAEEQLASLQARIDERIGKVQSEKDVDKVLKYLDSMLDSSDYSVLAKMDKTRNQGYNLIETTRAINYRREDMEAYIREQCAINAAKQNGDDMLDGYNPPAETTPAEEPEKKEEPEAATVPETTTAVPEKEEEQQNPEPTTTPAPSMSQPTPEPTPGPTAEPTPAPTAEPTPAPTPAPSSPKDLPKDNMIASTATPPPAAPTPKPKTGVQLTEETQNSKVEEATFVLDANMTLAERKYFQQNPGVEYDRIREGVLYGPLNPKLWEDPKWVQHNLSRTYRNANQNYIDTRLGNLEIVVQHDNAAQRVEELEKKIGEIDSKYGDRLYATEEIPEEITIQVGNGLTRKLYYDEDTGEYAPMEIDSEGAALSAGMSVEEYNRAVDEGISRSNAYAAQVNAAREKYGTEIPEDMPTVQQRNEMLGELDRWRARLEESEEEYQQALNNNRDASNRRNITSDVMLGRGLSIDNPKVVDSMIDYAGNFVNFSIPDDGDNPLATRLFYNEDLILDRGLTYGSSKEENEKTRNEKITDTVNEWRKEIADNRADAQFVLDSFGDSLPTNIADNIRQYIDYLDNQDRQYDYYLFSRSEKYSEYVNQGNSLIIPFSEKNHLNQFAFMDDYERDMAKAILARDGEAAALKYCQDIEGDVYSRQRRIIAENSEEMAQSGAAGRILNTAVGIGLAPVEVIGSVLNLAHTAITGKGENFLNLAGTISKEAYGATVNELDRVYGDSTKGTIIKGLYEIAYNRGRSAMVGGTFGGLFPEGTNEIFQAMPIATTAMNDAVTEALDNGVEPWKAWAIGTATFLAESVTEGIEFGHMKEAFGVGQDITKNGLIEFFRGYIPNALSEVAGESMNDIIEKAADYYLAGEAGDIKNLISSYTDRGYSEDEAYDMAMRDQFADVLHTAAISFFSQGADLLAVAGGELKSYAYYSSQARAMRNLTGDSSISVRDIRNGDIERIQRAEQQKQKMEDLDLNRPLKPLFSNVDQANAENNGPSIYQETSTGAESPADQPSTRPETAPVVQPAAPRVKPISEQDVRYQREAYEDAMENGDENDKIKTVASVLNLRGNRGDELGLAAANALMKRGSRKLTSALGDFLYGSETSFDGREEEHAQAVRTVFAIGLLGGRNANGQRTNSACASIINKSDLFGVTLKDLEDAVAKDRSNPNIQAALKENVAKELSELKEKGITPESILGYSRENTANKETTAPTEDGNTPAASPETGENTGSTEKSSGNAYDKDIIALENSKGVNRTAQAATVSAVLATSEADAKRAGAAANNLDTVFGENAVGTLQGIMNGAKKAGINSNMLKIGIQYASLADGACRAVVGSAEFQNASPERRAKMIAEAVITDARNEQVKEQVNSAIHEFLVAEAEKELQKNGAADSAIEAQNKADAAAKDAKTAEGELERKQEDVQSATDAIGAANEELQRDPEKGGPAMNDALAKQHGAMEVEHEYQQKLEKEQAKKQEAEEAARKAKEEAMINIRQQAEEIVAEQEAQEAQAAAEAAARAEEARQEQERLQAEEDQRSGKSWEQNRDDMIEQILDQEYLEEGEAREKRRQELTERANQIKLGRIDMAGMMNNTEGFLAVSAIGRRLNLGMKLSDSLPDSARGMYKDGVVYLNSNLIKNGKLTIGQALVEASLHEITHAMESTRNYQTYRDTVVKALFGSEAAGNVEDLYENNSRFRAAIDQKIADYRKSVHQELSIEDAEREIVADFARTKLNEKEVVQRFLDAGLGGKMRNTLHNINQALKNFKLKGEEKTTAEYLRRAERTFQKMINEAEKMSVHPEGGQFSVAQIAQATGMTFDDKTLTLYDAKGNVVDGVNNRITSDMIGQTPVGLLITNGLSDQSPGVDENGNAKPSPRQAAMEMMAGLMNMVARYKDSNLIWEIGASTLSSTFSALKSNSDPQYATTVDFGTVCAKTQAIIDVMSQVMLDRVKEGKTGGLTRDEIMKVYNETHNAGLSVPCPVCYVFSRWMGVPSLLGQMSQYQHDYVVTNEDGSINKEATQAKADEYIRNAEEKYGDAKAINNKKTQLQNQLAKLEEQRTKATTDEERQKILDRMVELDQQIGEVSAYNWVTQALCKKEKGSGKYVVDPKFKVTPDEILFDLNRTGEFAGYEKNWRYRNTRGAGMGKAIMPYSGESIGDILYGVKAKGRQNTLKNPWLNMDPKAAARQLSQARTRAKKQNLVGGQRLQSTSDFRPEWGLDYIMSFLELQAAGSKTQMYTKVPEAVDFFASVGADVNLSIMGKGQGWHADENGNKVLDFSSITGMDYETAKALKNKYDNVQMILVGMNDTHIRLAMANEDIDFIIPWHSSGNSKDVLAGLISSVGEKLDSSVDYSSTQTDSVSTNRTAEQKQLWDARVKLLTKGGDVLSQEERSLLLSNPFTADLYKRFTQKGVDPDCYGVKLNKAQANQIFPYEYWDTQSTKENADVNGQRFVEYCEAMGIVPRFSQFKDDPGYWKLLIDRPMYNNDGSYHQQQVIDVTNARIGALDESGKLTDSDLPTNAQAKYASKDPRSEHYAEYNAKEQQAIENAKAALDEQYDDGTAGQYSTYGDTTTADMEQMLSETSEDYQSAVERGDMEAAAEDVESYAASKGYTLEVFHGTGEYFNEFRRGYEGIHLGNREQAEQVAGLRYKWRSQDSTYNWADIRDAVDSMDTEQRESLVRKAYFYQDYFQDGQEVPEFDGDISDADAVRNYADGIFQRYAKADKSDPNKLRISMRTFDRKTGENIMHLYARINNPLVINGDIGQWDPASIAGVILRKADGETTATSHAYGEVDITGSDVALNEDQRAMLEKLNSMEIEGKEEKWDALSGVLDQLGFDGIQYLNEYEGDKNSYSYIALRQSDVKSADTVTYDDQGNVIPLSERFTDSPDIRYSADGTSLTDLEQVLANDKGIVYNNTRGSEVKEDVERRGQEIRERSLRKGQQDDWALDRQATLSVIGGDYSGIVADGKPGYNLFRAALNGSAILDKEGKPIILFHGSPAKFERFEKQETSNFENTHGHYLTTSPDVADFYAQFNGAEGYVYPVGVYSKSNLTFDASEFNQNYHLHNNALEIIEAAHNEAKKIEVDDKFINALSTALNQAVSDERISAEVADKILDAFETKGDVDSVFATRTKWDNGKTNDQLCVFDGENIVPATAKRWEAIESENKKQFSSGGENTLADLDQQLTNSGIISQEDIDAYNGNNGITPPTNGLSSNVSPEDNGPGRRQFGTRTAQESDALHDEVKDYLYTHSQYTPESNQEQIDRATDWVRSMANDTDPDGYRSAVDEVTSDSFDYRSADGQARMLTVMGMAALKNDIDTEMRLADAYNRQGTDLGRALQSRKIFRLMTPVGRISYFQKQVDNLNRDIGKKTGKTGTIHLDEWTVRAIGAAETEEDFAKIRKAVSKEIGEQIPANWKDKLRSWRMLAMLGNPRTHIRNIIGNAMFIPAVSIKNKLGAVAELGMAKGNRTKTISPVLRKDVRDFARQDAIAMRDTLTGEAKYNEEDLIQQNRRQFKGVFQALSDFNSNALEGEDWFFLKGHYRRALGGWMQSNGYTAEQMQNNPALLEKGREYAVKEAQKATYRDFNGVAKKLNELSQNPQTFGQKVLGFGVEAVLPFKKTPANILKRGIEYSPVGIARALTTDLYHLKQWNDYQNGKLDTLPEGAISPNQFIDDLCSGLTGTAIMAVGALLGNMGAVSCGLDDDDDEFEKLRGNQEYAIKFSIGGNDYTFTMDWAAPMCMPFFVGAAIQEQMANQEGFSIDELINAMGNITEPVFNLSMLDGVNSLLDMFTSGDDTNATITQLGAKIASNYATSYIPSILGATARTIDPYRRKSFVESGKGTGILGTARYAREQVENKIPGLSQTNIPYRDVWGNAEESGLAERILENFVLPGYINQYRDDPVVGELERIGKAPKEPGKTISNDGEKYILTDKQWDAYKTERGQTAYNLLGEMMATEAYQTAKDDEKAALIDAVWDYANKRGQLAAVPEVKVDDWIKTSKNPVGDIIEANNAKTQKKRVSANKENMITALENGDTEGFETMIEALRQDGVKDDTIRDKIRDTYRDQYKDAYRKMDYLKMDEIVEKMEASGLEPLDKNGDIKIFSNWEKAADKEEELSYETDQFDETPEAETPDWLKQEEEDMYNYTDGELYGYGNIDLNHRQVVHNPDGSISTEYSLSFQEDGQTILIPTVVNGRIVSEDEAIDHYHKTGEYLGKFDTQQEADEYAMMVHNRQDWYYHR